MVRTAARRPLGIAAKLLLAAPLLVAATGCVTQSLLESLPSDGNHVDWHNPGTYGLLALTPIAIGVDAAIVGAIAYGDGDRGCCCRHR